MTTARWSSVPSAQIMNYDGMPCLGALMLFLVVDHPDLECAGNGGRFIFLKMSDACRTLPPRWIHRFPVAIDQHFTQRGRGRDLLNLVETYPQYLGIGIDESTALVVQGSTGEVVGAREDRHVYFFDAARERGDHERMWVRLAPGGRYDLVQRAAQ